MGTLMDKLNATNASKEQIRQAIERKKVSVPENTPLKDYPAKIDGIYPDALFLKTDGKLGQPPIIASDIVQVGDEYVAFNATQFSFFSVEKGWYQTLTREYARLTKFSNGRFMRIVGFTAEISSDAISWVSGTVTDYWGNTASPTAFLFDGNKYFIGSSYPGMSGTGGVWTSTDGKNWANKTYNADVTEIYYSQDLKSYLIDYGDMLSFSSNGYSFGTEIEPPTCYKNPSIDSGNGYVSTAGMYVAMVGRGEYSRPCCCIMKFEMQKGKPVYKYGNCIDAFGGSDQSWLYGFLRKEGEDIIFYGYDSSQLVSRSKVYDSGSSIRIKDTNSYHLPKRVDINNNDYSLKIMNDYFILLHEDGTVLYSVDFVSWKPSVTTYFSDTNGNNVTKDVLEKLSAVETAALQAAYEAGVNSI